MPSLVKSVPFKPAPAVIRGPIVVKPPLKPGEVEVLQIGQEIDPAEYSAYVQEIAAEAKQRRRF